MFATLVVILATAAAEPLPNTQIEALPPSAALPGDTPAKIALGRLLFFDPMLSATRDVACATCHHPQHGWADARPTPLGVHASGIGPARRLVQGAAFVPLTRNTPTILNTAFNGIESGKPFDPSTSPMFWDNRAHGLEAQALVPIRQSDEMRGEVCSEADAISAMLQRLKSIPEYVTLFQTEITAEKVTQAIASYERTLIVTDTPFDRFMRGDKTAMTTEQQQGMAAFQKAGCALCHNGPMLSDTSTLPPLDPLLRQMNMLPEDHAPIKAFLDALNIDDYDKTVPERVPSGLPIPR